MSKKKNTTSITTAANVSPEFKEMTEQDQKESRPIPDLESTGITPDIVREHLEKAIEFVKDHISDYVVNPETDFTRNTVFDSATLMKFLIMMGAGSSVTELIKYFSSDMFTSPPHNSSFCMARQKLLPSALYAVFRHFTDSFPQLKRFKGYRIVGVDGSTINIPYNPDEKETLHQNREDQRCFNQCYFNGAYDLLNAIYVDVIITTLQKTDERSALLALAEKADQTMNLIYVCDRGYGGWNVFATLERLNRKFIIREKDKDSQGIFRSLDLSDKDEFDVVKEIVLTNKQTKETLSQPDKYKLIMTNQNFPYLDKNNHFFPMTLRFVRKKVAAEKYICMITNLLDKNEFSPDELQYIYYLRWGQEGSYRIFKYTIGALNFHARKYTNVRQELYAKMIEFNACQLIAGCVPMNDNSNDIRVLTEQEYRNVCNKTAESIALPQESTSIIRYKPNISAAVTAVKEYLSGRINTQKLILIIKKYLIPIRPGRSFARKIKQQSATTLLYRAS